MTRTLVAGIGNIFLGDDGFGVEVARRLLREPPEGAVDVVDFGIRGLHLAFEIASGRYNRVILIDALPRGAAPGTLHVIEPEIDVDAVPEPADAHSLTPAAVLGWLRRIGADCGCVMVVGCEPATLGESIGLSAPVAGVVDEAAQLIRQLVANEGRT